MGRGQIRNRNVEKRHSLTASSSQNKARGKALAPGLGQCIRAESSYTLDNCSVFLFYRERKGGKRGREGKERKGGGKKEGERGRRKREGRGRKGREGRGREGKEGEGKGKKKAKKKSQRKRKGCLSKNQKTKMQAHQNTKIPVTPRLANPAMRRIWTCS